MGLFTVNHFGCLIGSSGKHRFKLPARQPVTTVRDWRCWLSRGEDVIGVKKAKAPSVAMKSSHNLALVTKQLEHQRMVTPG